MPPALGIDGMYTEIVGLTFDTRDGSWWLSSGVRSWTEDPSGWGYSGSLPTSDCARTEMSMPRNEGILCCTSGCQPWLIGQKVGLAWYCKDDCPESRKLTWCMDTGVWLRIRIHLEVNKSTTAGTPSSSQ